MKKTYQLLFLTALIYGLFSACTKDITNPYEHVPEIKVISQELNFDELAGEGTIIVDAPKGITRVTSSKEWCKVKNEGNTVKVNVTENDELESRNARVTIFSQKDSVNVSVQQLGSIVNIDQPKQIIVNDESSTKTFNISSKKKLEVKASKPWIKATFNKGQLVVKFDANSEEHTEMVLSKSEIN